ncbi:NUDIX hydrolase [Halobacillus sp. BBL2006]|uniref:NUDIX hydrolase n=1 Tax=Halobacillus sp. BBL2006 TaxID=1543706 RepID=UPI000543451D|nr:NUDIX hydrolase [Halobacillus sp. BBL2006]KHE72627.1 phosphohydrolase [Halobacillus sp. BBL2006]
MDYITYLRSMVGKEKVLMTVCGAFVIDSSNRVLLQLRSDTNEWGLPGGFMEMNENVEDTARRETKEETGLELGELELFGVYSGPHLHKTFPNGDQAALVQILFTCRDYTGTFDYEDKETLDAKFFALEELPENIFEKHRTFLKDLIEKKPPVIG